MYFALLWWCPTNQDTPIEWLHLFALDCKVDCHCASTCLHSLSKVCSVPIAHAFATPLICGLHRCLFATKPNPTAQSIQSGHMNLYLAAKHSRLASDLIACHNQSPTTVVVSPDGVHQSRRVAVAPFIPDHYRAPKHLVAILAHYRQPVLLLARRLSFWESCS